MISKTLFFAVVEAVCFCQRRLVIILKKVKTNKKGRMDARKGARLTKNCELQQEGGVRD